MYGGADRRKTSFPPCRLRHPHRHARHDAIRRNGKKKRPLAVQKVRLSPVQKTAAYWTPLSGSPRGTSVSLCSCASAEVDVVVGRRASLWGITALLNDWVTDMTHVMLFWAISCSTVGVAARLQTVIPTLAIIIAGSYHLIRGLVPYDT